MGKNKNYIYSRVLGSVFGLGFVPFMPGTFASLICAVGAFVLFRNTELALAADIGILLIFVLLGILAATPLRALGDDQDPSWFVMDEFAGMWLAMLGLPKGNIPVILTAWLLFRIFDILKPWFIKRVDSMNSPLAVVLDDLLAAIPAWLGAFIVWKLL